MKSQTLPLRPPCAGLNARQAAEWVTSQVIPGLLKDNPGMDQPVEHPTSRDTIPESLKPFFFTGVEAPNMLEYDCIGFTDSFVKFNIEEVTRLVVQVYLEDLTQNFAYPTEILEFDYDNLASLQNNVVWDIEKGLILKLGENKIITRAIRGFSPLPSHEIQDIYGNPPVYNINWPASERQMNKIEGAHMCFIGYFACCEVPVVCQLLEQMESGNIKKSALEVAYDLVQVRYRQYQHFTNEKVFELKEYGKLLPALAEDPLAYIQPQPYMRDTLSILKQKGKKLFIMSNSHVPFIELAMSNTIGPDWKDFFTVILANCRKPLFWKGEGAFYVYDEEFEDRKGIKMWAHEPLQGAVHVSNYKVLLEGNASVLTKFFQRTLNKNDIKIALLADNPSEDIAPISQFESNAIWHSIAIIEELSQLDQAYDEGFDPHHVPHNMLLWGSSYWLDDPQCDAQIEKGMPVKNYFIDEVNKSARYAMPFVRNIKYLMGTSACKPLRSLGIEGVLTPDDPFELREKPCEHKECPGDSKEYMYFTKMRGEIEEFLGYDFQLYEILRYTEQSILNAGYIYQVKIRTKPDSFIHVKIAKKPTLQDMSSDHDEDESQQFVDEDNDYELEFVAYRENVAEDAPFEFKLSDYIRYHEDLDLMKRGEGEADIDLIDEIDKQNEDSSEKEEDEGEVPGQPCICPKKLTEEQYEENFNAFAKQVGILPKDTYNVTKENKIRPKNILKGMGYLDDEGRLENQVGDDDDNKEVGALEYNPAIHKQQPNNKYYVPQPRVEEQTEAFGSWRDENGTFVSNRPWRKRYYTFPIKFEGLHEKDLDLRNAQFDKLVKEYEDETGYDRDTGRYRKVGHDGYRMAEAPEGVNRDYSAGWWGSNKESGGSIRPARTAGDFEKRPPRRQEDFEGGFRRINPDTYQEQDRAWRRGVSINDYQTPAKNLENEDDKWTKVKPTSFKSTKKGGWRDKARAVEEPDKPARANSWAALAQKNAPKPKILQREDRQTCDLNKPILPNSNEEQYFFALKQTLEQKHGANFDLFQPTRYDLYRQNGETTYLVEIKIDEKEYIHARISKTGERVTGEEIIIKQFKSGLQSSQGFNLTDEDDCQHEGVHIQVEQDGSLSMESISKAMKEEFYPEQEARVYDPVALHAGAGLLNETLTQNYTRAEFDKDVKKEEQKILGPFDAQGNETTEKQKCSFQDLEYAIFHKMQDVIEKYTGKLFEEFEIEHYYLWFSSTHLIYTVKYLVGEDKYVHAKIQRTGPDGSYDIEEELTLVQYLPNQTKTSPLEFDFKTSMLALSPMKINRTQLMQDCVMEEIDIARAKGWLDEYDKNMTVPSLEAAREEGMLRETDTNPDLSLKQWAHRAHLMDDFNYTDPKHPVNNLDSNATEYVNYFNNEQPPKLKPVEVNSAMGILEMYDESENATAKKMTCKENDLPFDVCRKTRPLMEKKHGKKFESFEVVHYYLWTNWKKGRNEVYTAKIKIGDGEFVHAKVRRTPPLGMDSQYEQELLSLVQFKANETVDSKLDFANVPVISNWEGYIVCHAVERLPEEFEGDLPPADEMARKRFMAVGGNIAKFYESGAAAETWLTTKPSDYDFKLINRMRTQLEQIHQSPFESFDIIYYFKDEHEFGHIYQVKIRVNGEECVHAKIRRDENVDADDDDPRDTLTLIQFKPGETEDSYVDFSCVKALPEDDKYTTRFESPLDLPPDLPDDNVTNPFLWEDVNAHTEDEEKEAADKEAANSLIKNAKRVKPGDIKSESGLKKPKKLRQNHKCKKNSAEMKIFSLIKPVMLKQARMGFQKFDVIHYQRHEMTQNIIYWVKVRISATNYAHAKIKRTLPLETCSDVEEMCGQVLPLDSENEEESKKRVYNEVFKLLQYKEDETEDSRFEWFHVPIISGEEQEENKIVIDRNEIPQEPIDFSKEAEEVSLDLGEQQEEQAVELKPQDLNRASGMYDIKPPENSFEFKIFALMRPLVEKHHQNGKAYEQYHIVHYRRKNYGRGFLYWVKIRLDRYEWCHVKFRRQDDKKDPDQMTITLLQFAGMLQEKSKFDWFRVPLITKQHQKNFQLTLQKSDLPPENKNDEDYGDVKPDEILQEMGFVPTYTDESADMYEESLARMYCSPGEFEYELFKEMRPAMEKQHGKAFDRFEIAYFLKFPIKYLLVYTVKIKISETEYAHAKIIWPPKQKNDENPTTEVLQLWMFKNGETADSPVDFMYPCKAIDPEDVDCCVTFGTKGDEDQPRKELPALDNGGGEEQPPALQNDGIGRGHDIGRGEGRGDRGQGRGGRGLARGSPGPARGGRGQSRGDRGRGRGGRGQSRGGRGQSRAGRGQSPGGRGGFRGAMHPRGVNTAMGMYGFGSKNIDESKLETVEKLQMEDGTFEHKLITAMKRHVEKKHGQPLTQFKVAYYLKHQISFVLVYTVKIIVSFFECIHVKFIESHSYTDEVDDEGKRRFRLIQFESGQSHDKKLDFDSAPIPWKEGFYVEFDKEELPSVLTAKFELDYAREVTTTEPWYEKKREALEAETDSDERALREHMSRALGLLCPLDESYDQSNDSKNTEVKTDSFEQELFTKVRPLLEHRHGQQFLEYKILYFLQWHSKEPEVIVYSLKIKIKKKQFAHVKIMSAPYGPETNEKEFRYYLMNFITTEDPAAKLDFHNVPTIPRSDDCFLSFPVNVKPKGLDRATGMKKGQKRKVPEKKEEEVFGSFDETGPKDPERMRKKCKEGSFEHQLFTKLKPTMEKKYGEKFKQFDIRYYLKWKFSQVLMYTVKIRITPIEYIHVKIMRPPPKTDTDRFKFYMVSFDGQYMHEDKLDFGKMAVIGRKMDMFVSFAEEELMSFPSFIHPAMGFKKEYKKKIKKKRKKTNFSREKEEAQSEEEESDAPEATTELGLQNIPGQFDETGPGVNVKVEACPEFEFRLFNMFKDHMQKYEDEKFAKFDIVYFYRWNISTVIVYTVKIVVQKNYCIHAKIFTPYESAHPLVAEQRAFYLGQFKSRTTSIEPLDFHDVEILGMEEQLFVLVARSECFDLDHPKEFATPGILKQKAGLGMQWDDGENFEDSDGMLDWEKQKVPPGSIEEHVFKKSRELIEFHMGEKFDTFEPYAFAFGEPKRTGILYLVKIKLGEHRFIHVKIRREPSYEHEEGDDDERIQLLAITNHDTGNSQFDFSEAQDLKELELVLKFNPSELMPNTQPADMTADLGMLKARDLERTLGLFDETKQVTKGSIEEAIFQTCRPMLESASGEKFDSYKVDYYTDYNDSKQMYFVKVKIGNDRYANAVIRRIPSAEALAASEHKLTNDTPIDADRLQLVKFGEQKGDVEMQDCKYTVGFDSSRWAVATQNIQSAFGLKKVDSHTGLEKYKCVKGSIEQTLFMRMRGQMEARFGAFDMFFIQHYVKIQGMNERTLIAKIRISSNEHIHAAIVREGPLAGCNKVDNLYLSHFLRDQTEKSPIVFEEMESCMDGSFRNCAVDAELVPSEIKYFSSPEKVDSKGLHAASGMHLNESEAICNDTEMEDMQDTFFNETEFEDLWYNKSGRPVLNRESDLRKALNRSEYPGHFNASECPQGLENFTKAVDNMTMHWEEDFKKWQENQTKIQEEEDIEPLFIKNQTAVDEGYNKWAEENLADKTLTCEPGDEEFTVFAYMRAILEKKAGCEFSKYEVMNYSREPGEDYCVNYCVKIKVVFQQSPHQATNTTAIIKPSDPVFIHAYIRRWATGKDMDGNEVPWPYAYGDEAEVLCLMKYIEGENQISDCRNIEAQPDIADSDVLRKEWCKDLKTNQIKRGAHAIKRALEISAGRPKKKEEEKKDEKPKEDVQMEELREALKAEGMDLDDFDPNDIFPGLGLSKKRIKEQQKVRIKLELMKSLHRGMGVEEPPKAGQDSEKHRVFDIMQPMIEKHFGCHYDKFEVNSNIDTSTGNTGYQAIMARVNVNEADVIHICICRGGRDVSASAWRDAKASAIDSDAPEARNGTQIKDDFNKQAEQDMFFCSPAQNEVIADILDAHPFTDTKAYNLNRATGFLCDEVEPVDETDSEMQKLHGELKVEDGPMPFGEIKQAMGYDSPEEEIPAGFVEHGMFTEMRPFMEKAAGKKFEMFDIKFYRELIYGSALQMYIVKIKISPTEYIHAKVHRRRHTGKLYEETLWLSNFIANQKELSDLDPEAMSPLVPQDDYWHYCWKPEQYKERELRDVYLKKEQREMEKAERFEKERIEEERVRQFKELELRAGMGLEKHLTKDITGKVSQVVEKPCEKGSVEYALVTKMQIVMEKKAKRKFVCFEITKFKEFTHSPKMKVLLIKVKTDTHPPNYLHARIHRGRAYSTFGGTESLWLNMILDNQPLEADLDIEKMAAGFPDEGFALGFDPKKKEVYLDGKSGYEGVGTSWTPASVPRASNLSASTPYDQMDDSEDAGEAMESHFRIDPSALDRRLGLMGRIGLKDSTMYQCEEDPDDLELKLFKKMRRHMEIRNGKEFDLFKVLYYKICEGLNSRTYLIKIKVNVTDVVHAAIRRQERFEAKEDGEERLELIAFKKDETLASGLLFTSLPFLIAKDREEYPSQEAYGIKSDYDFIREPDYKYDASDNEIDGMMAKYLDVDLEGIDSNPEGDSDIIDTLTANVAPTQLGVKTGLRKQIRSLGLDNEDINLIKEQASLQQYNQNATEIELQQKKREENLRAVRVFGKMRALLEKKYEKGFDMYKLLFCDYTHGNSSSTYLGKLQISQKEYLHVVLHKTDDDTLGGEIRGKEDLPKHPDSTRLWKSSDKYIRVPEDEGEFKVLFHTREEIDEQKTEITLPSNATILEEVTSKPEPMDIDAEVNTENITELFSSTDGWVVDDGDAPPITDFRLEPDHIDPSTGILKDEAQLRWPEFASVAWKVFHYMRPLIEKKYGSAFEKYELVHYTRAYITGLRYQVKIMISSTEYIHASIRRIQPKGESEQTQLVYLMRDQTRESPFDFSWCKLIFEYRTAYAIDFDEYKIGKKQMQAWKAVDEKSKSPPRKLDKERFGPQCTWDDDASNYVWETQAMRERKLTESFARLDKPEDLYTPKLEQGMGLYRIRKKRPKHILSGLGMTTVEEPELIGDNQFFIPQYEKEDAAPEQDSFSSMESGTEQAESDQGSPWVSPDEGDIEPVEVISGPLVSENDPNFDESKLKIDCDMTKADEYDWEEYTDGSKIRIFPYTEDQLMGVDKLSIEEDLFNEMKPMMEKAQGKTFEKFVVVHHEVYYLACMYYKVKVQITATEHFHGLIRRIVVPSKHEDFIMLTHYETNQTRHSRFVFPESSFIKDFWFEYKVEWEPPNDQPFVPPADAQGKPKYYSKRVKAQERKRKYRPPLQYANMEMGKPEEEKDRELEWRQPDVEPEKWDFNGDDYDVQGEIDGLKGLDMTQLDRQNGILQQVESDNPPLTCQKGDLEYFIFNEMRKPMERKNGAAFDKFNVIKYEVDQGGAIHYRVKVEVGDQKYVHAIVCRQQDPDAGEMCLMLQHYQTGVTLDAPLVFGYDTYIGCFKKEYEARLPDTPKKPQDIDTKNGIDKQAVEEFLTESDGSVTNINTLEESAKVLDKPKGKQQDADLKKVQPGSIEEKMFKDMRPLLEKRHGKPFQRYEVIHYECDYDLHYRVKIRTNDNVYLHAIVTKAHLPEEDDETLLLTHFQAEQTLESQFDFPDNSFVDEFHSTYSMKFTTPEQQLQREIDDEMEQLQNDPMNASQDEDSVDPAMGLLRPRPKKLLSSLGLTKEDIERKAEVKHKCPKDSLEYKMFRTMKGLMEQKHGQPFALFDIIYYQLDYGSGMHYNTKIRVSETEYIDVIVNKVMLLYDVNKKLMLTHYKGSTTRDSKFDWEDDETFIETFSTEYSLYFNEKKDFDKPPEKEMTELEKFLLLRTDSENKMVKKYDNFTFDEPPFVDVDTSELLPHELHPAMGVLDDLDDDVTPRHPSFLQTADDGTIVHEQEEISECKPGSIEHRMFLKTRPLMEKRALKNGTFACFEPIHYTYTTFADREYSVKIKVDKDEYVHAIVRRRPPLYDPQEKLMLTNLMLNQTREGELNFVDDEFIDNFYDDYAIFWTGPKRPKLRKSRALARGELFHQEIEKIIMGSSFETGLRKDSKKNQLNKETSKDKPIIHNRDSEADPDSRSEDSDKVEEVEEEDRWWSHAKVHGGNSPEKINAALGLAGGSNYGRHAFYDEAAGKGSLQHEDYYDLEKQQCKPDSVEERAFAAAKPLLEEQYGEPFDSYNIVYFMRQEGIEPVYYAKIQISKTECIHCQIMRICFTKGQKNSRIQLHSFQKNETTDSPFTLYNRSDLNPLYGQYTVSFEEPNPVEATGTKFYDIGKLASILRKSAPPRKPALEEMKFQITENKAFFDPKAGNQPPVNFTSIDRGTGLCGAPSEIKQCEFADEQYMLFTALMDNMQEKSKVEFERFEIIHYTSQVVAGMIYQVKIRIAEFDYIHVKIFCTLKCNGGENKITHMTYRETKDSPLEFKDKDKV